MIAALVGLASTVALLPAQEAKPAADWQAGELDHLCQLLRTVA